MGFWGTLFSGTAKCSAGGLEDSLFMVFFVELSSGEIDSSVAIISSTCLHLQVTQKKMATPPTSYPNHILEAQQNYQVQLVPYLGRKKTSDWTSIKTRLYCTYS